MATETLAPPVSTTTTISTPEATNTSTNTIAGQSTSTGSTGAISNIPSALNMALMKQWGIAVISAIIAVLMFWQYRRGAIAKPMLTGIVLGASLLALISSIFKIVEITNLSNSLSASTSTNSSTTTT